MVSLRQLLQSLSPALIQSIEPGGARYHVAALLGEIEQCWQAEGAAIRAAVAKERQELIDSGLALAKAILADKAALASRFVARTEAFLELAACAHVPDWQHESTAIEVAIDDHRRLRVGTKQQLADYLRAGGPKQFAPESRLRDEVLTWVEGLDGWLDPYILDPLAAPPLLTLGAPPGGSMLHELTGFSDHGLWIARKAPWKRPARSAPEPRAWAPRTLLILCLEDAWREALDHAPWIKQLKAFHVATARSGWLAAHLLELLFGDTWRDGDRTAALACGHDYERWKVAAGSSLQEWSDSGPLRGEAVLEPSGFDDWAWVTFYEFRNRGTKPFIDLALQAARVSVYAIATLGDVVGASPPLVTEAERSAVVAQPSAEREDPFAVAEEGVWLRVGPRTFRFKKGQQAHVVLALYRCWSDAGRSDGCGMTEEALQDAAGSSAMRFRVRRTFAGSDALDTILRSSGAGQFALYLNEYLAANPE